MRRWIQEQRPDFTTVTSATINDKAQEEIFRAERRNEASYLRFEIESLQEQLVRISEAEAGRGASRVDDEDLSRMRMELVRARRELDKISGGIR